MPLQSKTFTVAKGDSLDYIDQFLNTEIGLNAFLIKTIKGVSLNENITQITLLFEKYSNNILDSIAPREGAIFSTGVASDDFDIRFLFNDPVDFRSILSGTFSIDGVGLDTDKIYLDENSNNYFLKISASGSTFQSDDFHTYQVGTSLKRLDGSVFSYTPVGGYVFHTLSSAHIGDYAEDYVSRRRGKLKIAKIGLPKGINPQQGISEFLSQRQLGDDRLITYTPVSRTINQVDVYFLYISQLEPQIIGGFPLNNSLLPDISAPGKVTFVFNTKLDKSKLTSTDGLFSIEEGFLTSTNVPASKVTLLDDFQTVEIDTSTYFTAQKIYSIIARPGILSLDGLLKEKPEQWTIHIAAYDGGSSTGSFTGLPNHSELPGLLNDDHTQYHTDTRASTWLSTEPPFTGHTGNPTVHFTQAQISIPSSQITDISNYTLQVNYTGHTGDTDIHYAQSEISILEAQISDLGDYTLQPVFTGHSGDVSVHFTMPQITISSDQITNISDYTLNASFTGHTGETGIHFTQSEITITESQISDLGDYASRPIFTGHSGDASIHFTQNDISITVDQIDPGATASGWVPTSDGVGGVFWSFISGGGSGITEPQFNSHVADFTGHTGDPSIHYTQGDISITESQISDLGDYVYSGDFTGHTGDPDPHTGYLLADGSRQVTSELISTVAAVDNGAFIRKAESDAADLAVTAYVDIFAGVLTSHTSNTSNPHSVTAAQVGAPTTAQFTGHTGETGVHYSMGSITITESQITDLGSYADASAFTGHTGNSTIHFTVASIQHQSIAGAGSYTHKNLDDHIDDTTTNPHGVTASQIGAVISGDFTGHTGDTTIHYTQASISIPLDQLNNVNVESLSTNDVLTWNGSEWVGSGIGEIGGGGASNLDGLTDVTLYSEGHLDTLVYTGGEFANATFHGAGGTTISLEDAGTNDYQLIISTPLCLETSNNLSDVTDVETARDNLKVQYKIDDLVDLVTFNSSSLIGAGQSFTMAINGVPSLRVPDAQGILALSTNTDTSSGAGGARRSMSTDGFDFSTQGVYCFRFMINNTSDMWVRVGMCNSTFNATSLPANAVYFELNSNVSSNWQAIVVSGSSITQASTSMTATDTYDTFKWVGIQGVGSGAYFYDMDDSSVLAYIGNLPDLANQECRPFVNIICNGASTHRRIYLDKFAYPIPAYGLPSGMWIV